MDDLEIILLCGFSTKYKCLLNCEDEILCPSCKTHYLSIKECLDLPRNSYIIKQKSLELKQKSLSNCLDNFQFYIKDSRFYIDETFRKVRNDIDLKRETLKLDILNKIDEYYQNLQKTIDDEYSFKCRKFEENVQYINSIDRELKNFKIEDNLNIDSKIQLFDSYCNEIDSDIDLINNLVDNLTDESLKFSESNEVLDIEKFFGKIEFSNNSVSDAEMDLSKQEILDTDEEINEDERSVSHVETSDHNNIEKNCKGIVKWFNAKNGYGFILRDATNEDIFVHQSAILINNPDKHKKSLKNGEEVEFDIIQGEKGREAINVTGPNGQAVQGSDYVLDKKSRRKRGSRKRKNRINNNYQSQDQEQSDTSNEAEPNFENYIYYREYLD